jgi:uncharacterized membrane protein
MEYFVLTFVVLVLIGVVLLFNRVNSLKNELAQLGERERFRENTLRELVRRVYVLEHQQGVPDTPAEAPEVTVAPPLVDDGIRPEIPPIPPVSAPETSAPSIVAQPRDWEALVGGNLLNKLGVLVLVIGIALFLGYSLTQLGPAGKITIGFLVGLSMLGAGVAVERREAYQTFGRGLIGGGWAAIYFTAYAAHGVESARVIESASMGTTLLLLVSAAMIAHSFLYASQAATSLAYLVGFVSLNVSPLNEFSVFAAFVLTLALLITAIRFDWMALGRLGVILTYATFALKYEGTIYAAEGLRNGQVLLGIYWTGFELFDVLDLQRRGRRTQGRAFPFLNACGFLIASATHRGSVGANEWGFFFTMLGLGYVASSLVRAKVAGGDGGEKSLVVRGLAGSWETTSAFALLAACSAVYEGLHGTQITIGLLAAAEVALGLGLFLRDRYLVAIGSAAMIFPFTQLVAEDVPKEGTFDFAGHNTANWSPVALLMAVVFYANRVLLGAGWIYSAAGSLLLGAVIHQEVEKSWATVLWAVLSFAALAAGVVYGKVEMRVQGYVGAVFTFIRVFSVNLAAADSGKRILTVAIVIGLFYAAEFLMGSRLAESRREQHGGKLLTAMGTVLLTALLYKEVRGQHRTVAWGLEGVSLLATGFWGRLRSFRISGLAVFSLCLAKLFFYDFSELDTLSRILSFIVLGLLLLGASWIYTRYRDQLKRFL